MYNTQLLDLDAFKKIIEIVRQVPEASTILFTTYGGATLLDVEQQESNLQQFLFTLFREYHLTADDYTFSSDIFDSVYLKFEQYIFSTEPFRSVWLIDIRNLHLAVDKIQLDRGVILRQTTHEEKVKALNVPFFSPFTTAPYTYLEIHETADRFTQPDQQEATKTAQAVVLALRLIKPNPLGIYSYVWDVPEQPFRLLRGMRMGSALLHSAFSGEKYILTEEDATAFPTLLRRAKRACRDTELATVITRFDDSYLRTKQEDKLIDYWVALEALFFSLIPKEYVSSMGDTVASNIAYYIGETESERRSIFASIIASHKVRGYLVHGQRGTAPENLDLIVKKTENHLRQALRKRIEENI